MYFIQWQQLENQIKIVLFKSNISATEVQDIYGKYKTLLGYIKLSQNTLRTITF